MKKLLSLALVLALCLSCVTLVSAEGTEKVFRTSMASDCPTLNVQNCVETQLETPAAYTSANLFRAVPTSDGLGYEYVGDIASELPTQIDAHTWQIKIRPEACWANGDPINADTFMYTFKMMLDPDMNNSMANFLYSYNIHIVNAEEYATQKIAPEATEEDPNPTAKPAVAWEDVGIKKIDDYTLEITTVDENTQADVCAHFANRANIPVYEPYYEAGMSEDRTSTTYGATLDQYMSCGPYVLDTWTFDSVQVYVKNDKYWDPDRYHYDRVEISIIPDSNAQVELWEKGELDNFTPAADVLETYIDDPRLYENTSNTVHHIDVSSENPNNPLCKSLNYRKALYYAVDREVLADLWGYCEPTGVYASVQCGILSESHLTYRESEYGKAVEAEVAANSTYGYNPELAREYLAKAYEECGVSEDTVITLVLGFDPTDGSWPECAEYLEQALPEVFEGKIAIELRQYSISTTQWKANTPDWDITFNEWARSAARTYPYQIFYYYTSNYSNHPNNYLDADFDAQYAVCDAVDKADYETMLKETQKLEEIYLDKVINIPVVQEVTYTMYSDRMQLPVSTYIPGFGWGDIFGDIVE